MFYAFYSELLAVSSDSESFALRLFKSPCLVESMQESSDMAVENPGAQEREESAELRQILESILALLREQQQKFLNSKR